MKAFVVAVIALVAISVGSNMILRNAGFSAAEQNADSNVRLGD